jgi:hypothetical protein
MYAQFLAENLKGRDHAENLDVDGRIILEWIFEKWWKVGDCIHLSQDRDLWRAVVNTVMNPRV